MGEQSATQATDESASLSRGATGVRSEPFISGRPAQTQEPLPGVQVTEFEATLPLEIYGELFKEGS